MPEGDVQLHRWACPCKSGAGRARGSAASPCGPSLAPSGACRPADCTTRSIWSLSRAIDGPPPGQVGANGRQSLDAFERASFLTAPCRHRAPATVGTPCGPVPGPALKPEHSPGTRSSAVTVPADERQPVATAPRLTRYGRVQAQVPSVGGEPGVAKGLGRVIQQPSGVLVGPLYRHRAGGTGTGQVVGVENLPELLAAQQAPSRRRGRTRWYR